MGKVFTSFEEVNRAYNKVRMELWRLGVLWDGSKLDAVECIYEPLQWRGLIGWMGFYEFLKCKGDGNIHFPAVYNGLDLRLRWIDKNSTIDVFRHEFGHALSDRYPGALKKIGVFRAAFGGTCDDEPAPGTDPEDWEGRCVTPYAATKTREDFAETFMLFLRNKGRMPARFRGLPDIESKWDATHSILSKMGWNRG